MAEKKTTIEETKPVKEELFARILDEKKSLYLMGDVFIVEFKDTNEKGDHFRIEYVIPDSDLMLPLQREKSVLMASAIPALIKSGATDYSQKALMTNPAFLMAAAALPNISAIMNQDSDLLLKYEKTFKPKAVNFRFDKCDTSQIPNKYRLAGFKILLASQYSDESLKN